jgi:hypothetical protein
VALLVPWIGSGTRAAWVGVGTAGLLVALARWRDLAPWVRSHRGVAAAGVALALAGAVVLVVLSPVGGRLSSLTDPDAPGGSGRLDEWAVAARVIGDHPVLGVGPEGYRIAFGGAVDEGYQRAHGRDQQPDRAHAGPLDVALSGGLVALAAWSAIVVMVGAAAWRALRDGPAWLAGSAAALVAHGVTQLFFFPTAELEPVAWLLAGVVVASTGLAPEPTSRSGRPAMAAAAVVAVVAMAAGVTDVVADHRADDAADALARGDGRAAAAHAADAIAARGDVLRLHLLASQAALLDDQGSVAALREVDAALALSPGDPIALRSKATLLVARAAATGVPAHRSTAARFVARRLRADPYEPAYWRLQAALAQLDGQGSAAASAQARAAELTPPDRR